MKKGFYTIMSAQFFSSLADNALFVAAVELLRTSGAAEWQRAALVPMFALFYVVLAPFVGAFADAVPKGKVMFISNTIKVLGCLSMLVGVHPLIAYAIVGIILAVQKRRTMTGERRMSDFDRMDEVVRRKPTVHAMRTELDETDRRLMAIDHHLNTQNDELAREIEKLREPQEEK